MQSAPTKEKNVPGVFIYVTHLTHSTRWWPYNPAPTLRPSFQYGGSFLLNAVQVIQEQDNAAGRPHDELQMYLKAGAKTTTDIVGWWGVSPAVFTYFMPIWCS